MYDVFIECLNGLYLPNRDLCPDDYLWRSLREYSWYFREQMAGFDPEQCKGRRVLLIEFCFILDYFCYIIILEF